MAKMGIVENGLRRRRRARRKNPTVAATVRTKNPARRTVSLASAKAVAKRNGLKLVSTKAVANGRKRHKRRRRNGISVTSITRRSNGLLGNTKSDAKQVAVLGGGALATKMIGRVVLSFAQSILSSIGVGNYAEIIVDGATALIITPFIAGKLVKGSDVQKMARLGGLLVVGLDLVEAFAPNALQWNPFNTSPVIMGANGQAGITPSAVAAIAQGVANSLNPTAEAAKVTGALAVLESGQGWANTDSYTDGYMPQPELVL